MADVGDLIETAIAKPWLGMMIAAGTVAASLGARWLSRHDDGKPVSLATKFLFGLALATFFIGGALPAFRRIATPPSAPATTPQSGIKTEPLAQRSQSLDQAPRETPIKPTETVATSPPPLAAPEVMLQIGAVSSRALADRRIAEVLQRLDNPAGLTGGINAVSKNGTMLYQTYLTGFSSRESARAACERLTTVGQSCFVK